VAGHPDADAKLKLLNDAGVEARGYYRVPLHRQPAMAPYVTRQNGALELPVTEELARTGLALPISPVFTRAQADEVVAALR
jgi:dTDP-3-amino-3,4,6-trideoxy-alpha-D-glucose transaminase